MSEAAPIAELRTEPISIDPRGLSATGRPDWRTVSTAEERKELCELRDWRSWLTLATNWGLVFGAMALVAWLPNPVTIVASLFIIGARQLGLAVVMHEAAHRTLFRGRRLNDWAGSWLAAYPVWSDLHTYRNYHLKHHSKNWTEEDPDLHLAKPFPISRASMKRKIWRDLSGQTGLKFARFSLKRDAGLFIAEGQESKDGGKARLRGMIITNLSLLAVLTLAGAPALYLLWVAAWFTTYTLVTRFRSIAEHSMVPDPTDELRNTRTTLASWWERLLIAPNRVNYHLEHHLVMTVPHYNLPRMHRLLRERGVLDHALIAKGYTSVLRQAASAEGS
jgi:fatty acid desaturase